MTVIVTIDGMVPVAGKNLSKTIFLQIPKPELHGTIEDNADDFHQTLKAIRIEDSNK